MTMTESTEQQKPKTRRAKPRRKVAAAAKPDDFAALTVRDCLPSCNANGCVISGRPYCAHPCKGGLQGADMARPDALARLNRAKKIIGKKKLDLTGD